MIHIPGVAGLSHLKRDTMAYGAAMILDRALGFVLLPVLTRNLDKDIYGAWSQVLTAYALLSSVLLLGFYHAIMRYIPARPREEVGRVFHGMVALAAVSCGLFTLLVLAAPQTFSKVLFASSAHSESVPAVAAFVVAECLFELVVVAFLRAERRIALCAVYQAGKSVVRLAVIWLSTQQGQNLASLLFDLALVDVILIVGVYGFHIAPRVDIAIRSLGWKFWRGILGYSLPIVATTALGWANVSINRFLIVHTAGLPELAVFSANYSIASIASLVSLVMSFTMIPHTNAAWNRGKHDEVRRILEMGLSYYLLATLPLAVSIVVFYSTLLRVLAPNGYAGSPLLVWSLVIFMVMYGIEQVTIFATLLKNSGFSVAARGLSLGINVTLYFLLWHAIGIAAAGVAAVAAMAVTIALSVRRLNHMVEFRFPWRTLRGFVLPTAGMAAVGYGVQEWAGTTLGATAVAGVLSIGVFLMVEAMRKHSLVRSLLGFTGTPGRGPKTSGVE